VNTLEFVSRIKSYAVDDTVEVMMRSLQSLPIVEGANSATDPVPKSISDWMAQRAHEQKRKSEWFKALDTDDQIFLRDLLAECAEMTAASLFTFLDGVGGDSEGVFEVVEVIGDERNTLNSEDSEMLHDLFSEVCEQGRN
jgi:hypothetical protein